MEILIVEDEPDEARSMQMILEDKGYQTTWVDSVSAAEKALLKGSFNLILLDIILPYELGNKLLENMIKTKDKTPVIVITAISEKLTTIKKDVKKINPKVGFISKPFTASKLISEIKKYVK